MIKHIKVLGPGCPKCERLLGRTRQVVEELQLECSVEKVTDIQQIVHYGVMMTPALVVDNQVKVSGRVPSYDDIKSMLDETAE